MAPSYVLSELRHRLGRTIVTALGLAAGVGLVMAIIGVSTGLSDAQNKVLSPLSSVGTDLIVTRTVAPTTTTSHAQDASAKTSGSFFGGTGKGLVADAAKLNAADQNALVQANSSVLTDLSKLGPPGTKFTHDFFVQGTLITFPAQAVAAVSKVSGVSSAVGALSMSAVHETGTVPKIVASLTTNRRSVTVAKPAAFTAAQLEQTLACVKASGTSLSSAGSRNHSPTSRTLDNAVVTRCLPAADRAYYTHVIVPAETIHQVVSPPSTNTRTTTYTVAGVDTAHPATGLVTRDQLKSGSWYDANSAREVLVNSAYASSHHLNAGERLSINGTAYTIEGIVAPTLTGNVADLYFALPTLQKLATSHQRVNEVLVSVADAGRVDSVAAEIQKALPGAQVLTSKDLAEQVTGSLANAHKLANDLGVALALVVLLAGFAIAVLLTLSNITKRVREIGSLRAMGWSRGLVVRQILAETLGIGVLGGVLGVAVGAVICGVIDAVGPTMSVTSSGLSVGASAASALFGQSTSGSMSSTVSLNAPIELTAIILSFLGAIVGGAVAGTLGGWRAARLAPAEALRDLG